MEASSHQQQKEKEPRVHRPCAFDKMEGLVREMQDPENGVPVRSQKQFLTSIPSAFMGYDLIEWLMERLAIEESVEAVHIANQLCQYGYFFPVNDSKTLTVKDDSSLYRFQTPYYWPWQHRTPDNVEYAIYLAKRTLRNKQRHALEDYEIEALNSLRKNLQNKWDVIQLQAEEQVRLSKERKKGDKIVSDSQERAFWRVYRPPPGCLSSLEVVPVPTRFRPGVPHPLPRKRTLTDLQREVALLRNSLIRTRIKVSAAIENLKSYYETYMEYDPMFVPPQPSNPWITEDQTFWQLNSPLVEVPTEKRVRRWGLSMEEIMSDPTGLQEFTNYLRKEYSHENIRFWLAVKDLRHSFQAQIPDKVNEIFKEFLAPGAPCEINIDGKTMEKVHQEMKNPSRYTFDAAVEHVYTLLLKKDCYPRFIRSDHYRNLLAAGVQPLQKKRFFGFGGQAKKKASSSAMPMSSSLQQQHGNIAGGGRRRGSDRSLSGSAHELAVCGVRDITSTPKVPHSHSQSNLTDIPYRGDLARLVKIPTRPSPHSIQDAGAAEGQTRPTNDVCPWDAITGQSVESSEGIGTTTTRSVEESQGVVGDGAKETRSVNVVVSQTSIELPPGGRGGGGGGGGGSGFDRATTSRKNSSQLDSCSSSSDVSLAIAEVSERLRKTCHFSSTASASTVTPPTPAITRNYSTGSTSVRVKLSEIGRASVASCSYASPRQSFESATAAATAAATATATATATVATVATVATSSKTTQPSPLLEVAPPDVSPSDAPPPPPPPLPDLPTTKGTAPSISVGAIVDEPAATEKELSEDAQVVPVWEPDARDRPDDQKNVSANEKTSVAATEEKRDNKVNEVCPWEDEENCRVDAPYVKTYATLGYL